MFYLTAFSNKKWPINDGTRGDLPEDTEVHRWEGSRPILTTMSIINGDLGTSKMAGHWAIDYGNIVCLDEGMFQMATSNRDIDDSEVMKNITRKVGLGHWPLILVSNYDVKLERVKLVDRIYVEALDPYPHSVYRYKLFTVDVAFVNNASVAIRVPHDLIWCGDESDVGRVCQNLYHDHDFRRHGFTIEEFEKIKVDLDALDVLFDVGFLDGDQRVIRFHTDNLDIYQAGYQNRLDPTGHMYDIDISRQIKDAEGTYGIIRKRDHRHHGEHKPGHPDHLISHAHLGQYLNSNQVVQSGGTGYAGRCYEAGNDHGYEEDRDLKD